MLGGLVDHRDELSVLAVDGLAVSSRDRRLQAAVQSGDGETVEREHRALVSVIDKAAEHGALHRNNAARKKARAARIRSGKND